MAGALGTSPSSTPVEPPPAKAPLTLRGEVRSSLRLSLPIILTQLGSVLMHTVDAMMVGHLGAVPIAEVAIGNALAFIVLVFGYGALAPFDALVGRAHGAGDAREEESALRHGVWMGLLLAIPMVLVLHQSDWIASTLGALLLGSEAQGSPALAGGAAYARVLGYGTAAFLLFLVVRAYLQGKGLVIPALVVMLAGNILNALGNWLLIDGHLGFPALGALGSAWSTTIVRLLMVLSLAAYALLRPGLRAREAMSGFFQIEIARLRRLLAAGLPVGAQTLLRTSCDVAIVMLMGRLGSAELAGHHVAYNFNALASMLSFGAASAAAVRVGQRIGAGDPQGAAFAVRAAHLSAVLAALLVGAAYLIAPRALAGAYTSDPRVIAAAAALLPVGAALFLLDGVHIVSLRGLHGLADTRTPSLFVIACHVLISLPLGYALAFPMGYGAPGLWWGNVAGTFAIAAILTIRFSHKARALIRAGGDRTS